MWRRAAGPVWDLGRCNRSGNSGGRFSSTTGAQPPKKTIGFSGPSISEAEVQQLAPCVHAPPIKRGDLEAAGDYDTFVILDGEFGQNLSVTPKRSEEHTSELQSQSNLVCRLLLEKKKYTLRQMLSPCGD